MSTEIIYQSVLKHAEDVFSRCAFKDHLDIGSGRGGLIRVFREKFGVRSRACDYTKELMVLEGQEVDIVNLNEEKLPYADESFDIVTCTEVVEHLENYRKILREIHRVLRPGGVCILTTPNILNLHSRLRFLWFGFYNLFGPLPFKNSTLYSTGGHITPISYFHLVHALHDANFKNTEVSVDKYQRSSLWKLILFFIPIRFFGWLAMRKEIRKYRTVTSENQKIVEEMNSIPILLGRTIVVLGIK